MGKKGLSRDEKLQKVQELLHETKTAMTLKELETKCNRDKGVVANTVKDIAAELVSDNLVCCEKIGLSNYYWYNALHGFQLPVHYQTALYYYPSLKQFELCRHLFYRSASIR